MATKRLRNWPPPAPQCWGVTAASVRDVLVCHPRGSEPRRSRLRQAPPSIGGRGGAVALTLLLALLLAAAFFPASARADALDDQVRAIAKQLRCPVCTGETVADSNADVSIQIRGVIRQKLEAGETPDQIKAYFVARYGEGILLTPETSGFTLGVWVMPVVALVVGLIIVLGVLRSWSRRGGEVVAEEPVAVPAAPLPEADDERLEQELARFRQGRVRGGGVGG
jgi:cytochrome c-type biogenesis protein CcmH